MTKLLSAAELEKWRNQILAGRDASKAYIMVCAGTGCRAMESAQVASAFEEAIKDQGIANKVELKKTGCHGFCEQGPLVVIHPDKVLYTGVKPKDVSEIVSETIVNGKIVDRLLFTDPITSQKIIRGLCLTQMAYLN